MKIRVMGTADECRVAQAYYRALERQDNVKYVSVSELYPNRGSNTLFRVYIDVCYKSETEELRFLDRLIQLQEGQMRFPVISKEE